MNIKKCMTFGACVLISAAAFAGEKDQAEILRRIDAMQKQLQEQQVRMRSQDVRIEEQQALIEALEAQLTAQKTVSSEASSQDRVADMVKREVDATIEKRGLAQIKDSPAVKLGKYIDELELKGDLRVRYQHQTADRGAGGEEQTRKRWRHRLRLGGVWKNSTDSWEIGVGVASGGSDGRSTNQTWEDGGDGFASGDLRVDYAYAKHDLDPIPVCLTLGQQKNPFATSWILWDGDLRPQGLTAKFEQEGLFATVGGYNIDHLGWDESNAMLYAGQVGYRWDTEAIEALLALGYYGFNDVTVDEVAGIADDDYSFAMGDLYGYIGSEVGAAKVKIFGQLCKNFGADGNLSQRGDMLAGYDPDDGDLAWALGAEAKIKDLKLSYAYASIGADSMPAWLNDSDFGDGVADTDLKGHKIGVGYSLSKNLSLGATALLFERDEADVNNDKGEVYQFDVKYKF